MNRIEAICKRIWKDIKTYYIAAILFLIYNAVVRHFFHAFCPFLIMTGFPCAGCGMTRAVYYILTGQIVRGMDLNPAAPLWIAWFAFFAVKRYIRGKDSKWTMRLLGGVWAVTLVIYAYRMATQFPGSPPMTYYRNNLMTKYSTICHNFLHYIKQLW